MHYIKIINNKIYVKSEYDITYWDLSILPLGDWRTIRSEYTIDFLNNEQISALKKSKIPVTKVSNGFLIETKFDKNLYTIEKILC